MKVSVGWVEERNPTQLLKNVGFHYRSTQPTMGLNSTNTRRFFDVFNLSLSTTESPDYPDATTGRQWRSESNLYL